MLEKKKKNLKLKEAMKRGIKLDNRQPSRHKTNMNSKTGFYSFIHGFHVDNDENDHI